jgi:N utilization substance protein A
MSASQHDEAVRLAFRNHVPEVAAGVVDVVSIAREAGHYVMVTVRSRDSAVHPVSVCTGARAKSIMAELGGEKVSILLWSESVGELIMHTMLPGRMGRSRTPKVTLDPERHQARVQVEPDTLKRMIASDGLLLRLASRLVGWDIKLLSYDESSAA